MAVNTTHYEQFTTAERLTLLLEAMARDDTLEVDRLGRTCPRRTYSQADVEFTARMDLAFDIVALVCIDLRSLWGKLHLIQWVVGHAQVAATEQQITATLAFVDGSFYGEGSAQIPYFRSSATPRLPARLLNFPAAKANDDDDATSSDAFALDERMAAVETRAQATSEALLLPLLKTADDLARSLVHLWEAFGRFCRTRIAVSPATMLNAWGIPIAREIEDAVERWSHLRQDPAEIDTLFKLIIARWDKRFGDHHAIDDTALRSADRD